VFKAFGRALRMAAELDERAAGTIPSTKGSL
jgi:imidazoleglycerol-phosphate dehydratase